MATLQKQSRLEGIEINLQGNISIKNSYPVQLISGNSDAAFWLHYGNVSLKIPAQTSFGRESTQEICLFYLGESPAHLAIISPLHSLIFLTPSLASLCSSRHVPNVLPPSLSSRAPPGALPSPRCRRALWQM